jgi:excisionase family DNA binding protein
MPTYLTTAEVAETLRTPTETVRFWRHVGKGPKSFKVGRRVLYAEDDLRAWIEAQQAGERVAS